MPGPPRDVDLAGHDAAMAMHRWGQRRSRPRQAGQNIDLQPTPVNEAGDRGGVLERHRGHLGRVHDAQSLGTAIHPRWLRCRCRDDRRTRDCRSPLLQAESRHGHPRSHAPPRKSHRGVPVFVIQIFHHARKPARYVHCTPMRRAKGARSLIFLLDGSSTSARIGPLHFNWFASKSRQIASPGCRLHRAMRRKHDRPQPYAAAGTRFRLARQPSTAPGSRVPRTCFDAQVRLNSGACVSNHGDDTIEPSPLNEFEGKRPESRTCLVSLVAILCRPTSILW